MADSIVTDVLNVVLTEFRCLRDEINQRATYCHTLISINVLASGTLAGLAITNPTLLLLLPILNPTLGLLWVDHSFAIRNMGDYINLELKPAVLRVVEVDPELLRWQTFLQEHVVTWPGRLLRMLPLGVPIVVMFSATPVFALFQSFDQIGIDAKGALWAVGFLLTLVFFVLWYILIFAPHIMSRRVGAVNPYGQPQKGPHRV